MRKRRMGGGKGGGEGEEGRRLERRPGGFRSALACRHSYKSGADRRALARPEAPWCPVGARAACEVTRRRTKGGRSSKKAGGLLTPANSLRKTARRRARPPGPAA